ncbi:PH domain-containing protein [Brachybacterium sp. J144]|uniref:PH domain-containing protein n=1 Tax=Brachybacterium sp. J144 TaxID=3116487 RepID=UPI002E785F40|nr:PH domain-containing protein [Brachybacterium sp. J144]MEE1649430.1 PH domain-containing protein [Brachybacterium sp. J144]
MTDAPDPALPAPPPAAPRPTPQPAAPVPTPQPAAPVPAVAPPMPAAAPPMSATAPHELSRTSPEISDAPPARLGAAGMTPVSEKLIPARYLGGIPGYAFGLLLVAGAIVGAVLTSWWWIGALGALPLIVVVQGLLFTPRRVRALGYRVGEEDLTVVSGILFRTVETVPFGRVQSVNIGEGPVERRYGLATITLGTAHKDSAVTLPGLPREEAERLRTLLTARGVELMAAL